MIKSNSKKARERIRAYIIDSFHDSDFERWHDVNVTDYSQICGIILGEFYLEKLQHDNRYKAGRISRFEMFRDWCSGLPSILGCEYYYNVSAVDLLAAWLEETETEKERYTESQAEETITRLIYRELDTNARFLPKIKKSDVDKMPDSYKFKTKNGIYKGFFSGLLYGKNDTVLLTENVHFTIVNE